jgi:mycofactocin precursor
MAQEQSDSVQDAEALDVQDGVVEETLVEEVSIDGMCGVY